jgi:histidyl-tRNA synthetase
VIVGKDEMAKRSVTLRDMASGEQTVVPADNVAPEIAKRVG